jgi:hypothetical protein
MSKRRSKSEIVAHLMCKSKGLRSRVDSNCVNCIYVELEPGTWRQQVELCTVSSCPLWDVRAQSRAKPLKTAESQFSRIVGQPHATSQPRTGYKAARDPVERSL